MYPTSATSSLAYQSGAMAPPVERVQLHAQATELFKRIAEAGGQLDSLLARINGPKPTPLGVDQGKVERQPATIEVIQNAIHVMLHVEDRINELVTSIG